MKKLTARSYFSFALLLLSLVSYGQTDSLTTVVNMTKVGLDDHIQVSYTYAGIPITMNKPESEDFKVITGPWQSESSTTKKENGKVVTSTSITFKYIYKPTKTGILTIPMLSILNEKKERIYAKHVQIEVVKGRIAGDNPRTDEDVFMDMLEPSDVIAERVSKSKRPFVVTLGPVYYDTSIAGGGTDTVRIGKVLQKLEEIIRAHTKYTNIGRYSWAVSWADFMIEQLKADRSLKLSRMYFTVDDTAGLSGELKTLMKSEGWVVYMNNTDAAKNWNAYNELAMLRGAFRLYDAIYRTDRAKKDAAAFSKEKNIVVKFRFETDDARERFATSAKALKYAIAEKKEPPKSGGLDTGNWYEVSVSKRGSIMTGPLMQIADELLGIATANKGSYATIYSED